MITDKIKSELSCLLSSIYQVSLREAEIELVRPKKKEFGDFSTNVSLILSKRVGKSPLEIATEIEGNFKRGNWGTALIKRVEIVNGFVNIFLDHEYYQDTVTKILKEQEHFGDLSILGGQKIQVEFISANPTGPLTLANGRGGFGGDVLANVLAKAGATVEREYYVNDGGNQVKVLGKSLLFLHEKNSPEEDLYKGDYVEDWEAENSDLMKKYQNDPFALGQIAAKDLLENQIKPSVEKMNIHFDHWFSEKEMIDRGEVDEAIVKLKDFKHTKEEDGALWMKTTEFGDDKDRVLIKFDGEKTYFANDVAYHFDKLYKRKFDKVVNFWGADHHGYVGRMLAAVSAMGCPGKLKIVIMQLVRLIKDGEEFKMSKRKGTYVTMDELLELIGGNERDASDVARFLFLMRSFNTHMDFDLDLAKERSDKNPVFYVKYAYARMHGILENYKVLDSRSLSLSTHRVGDLRGNDDEADLSLLVAPEELELIDQLAQLEQVIMGIVSFDDYPVHLLTYYAIDVAKKFHQFYDKCRVIDEENSELSAARIELVRATQVVLGITMRDLIGIDAPERM